MVRQKGYLLVEVLVSITLLAIGVTGFCITHLHGIRSSIHASLISNASSAAIAVTEQLRLHRSSDEIGNLSYSVSVNSEEQQLSELEYRSYQALIGFMPSASEATAVVNCNTISYPSCGICISWPSEQVGSGNHNDVCVQPIVM